MAPEQRVEQLAELLRNAGLPPPANQQGLPPIAEELLRRRLCRSSAGKIIPPFQELAAHLDLAFPGWPEAATDLILAETDFSYHSIGTLAAHLLALRPITFSSPLSQALAKPANPVQQQLCALALLNTDTAEVRSAYRRAFINLAGRCLPADCSEFQALWTVFARLACESRLTYDNLLLVALKSQLFHPEVYPCRRARTLSRRLSTGDDLYIHPLLDHSGISSLPEFRRLYAMLVAEIMPSITDDFPWKFIRWIRCFPGPDYLFEALDLLDREPANLYALFVLRWAQRTGEDSPDFIARLAHYRPLTLMLLSLLRPGLDETVGTLLNSPFHAQALAWVRLPNKKAAAQDDLIQHVIFPWAKDHSTLFSEAMGILCSIKIPSDEPFLIPSDDSFDAYRLQCFHELHFLTNFTQLMDNLLLLQASRDDSAEHLASSAACGRLAAVRALGLLENISEDALRRLLELRTHGTVHVRRAADCSLEKIAARHKLSGIDELYRRLDLAAAWEDGGLAASPARVWWDIAGYRVKLSLAQGKVEVSAWNPDKKKTIPAKVRAHPDFAQVQSARKTLARAYGIFHRRLEDLMLTGGVITASHFSALFANPAFRSLISRLVVSLDGKEYLFDELEQEDISRLIDNCQWARVVHPVELWAHNRLELWQERVANRYIAQPFKQCFREIYPLESTEQKETLCLRFLDQSVLGPKSYALLKRRGYSPCQGTAFRDWPQAGLRAYFTWSQQSEDLWEHLIDRKQSIPLKTGAIFFTNLSDASTKTSSHADPLPLETVDPVIFSETLRDADLVVSAAAAGEEGFSSRQTQQIRAALIKNFARLLNLPGVNIDASSSHALVRGELASYRIHLGSGRILIDPAGRHLPSPPALPEMLPLLPDEKGDSRTLAILEAVAALAHDSAISDPDFIAAVLAR